MTDGIHELKSCVFARDWLGSETLDAPRKHVWDRRKDPDDGMGDGTREVAVLPTSYISLRSQSRLRTLQKFPMSTLFQGLHQAQQYATCRPTYPRALYEKILSRMTVTTTFDELSSNRNTNAIKPDLLCVDVGCGTGQATVAMVDSFDAIIGIDPSKSQLGNAARHPKVTYMLGRVEERLGELPDASVACLISAQAAHWLEIPEFYKEVNRVLKPGGVVALWTYGLNSLPQHPTAQAKMEHLYHNVLGDIYWDARRKLVENEYKDIPLISEMFPEDFKGERISESEMNIVQEIAGGQLIGYLRSWSGYNSYCNRNKVAFGSAEDPLLPIEELVAGEANMESIWPVTMLLAVKNQDFSK